MRRTKKRKNLPPPRADLGEATATYIRLRDGGGWGLRVVGDCSPGMTVIAVSRNGEQQRHVIGRILWARDGFLGCTIASREEANLLAARPNHNFDADAHVTRPAQPVPPDDGSIPFDPPYRILGVQR